MFEAARQPEQYGYMAAYANPAALALLAGSRAKRGHIGRIMLTPQTPGRQPWFWTIPARVPQALADRGYVASRELAMADFKSGWTA